MSHRFFGIIAPHPPIMVPEVGGPESEVTEDSAAAMRRAAQMLRRYDPDVLVVMSPHAPGVSDAFVVETSPRVSGSLAQFRAPQVRIDARTDTRLAREVLEDATEAGIPVIDRSEYPALHPGVLDHGYLVPMSFLDPDGRYPVVVLSLSWLPLSEHRRFGAVIAGAAERLGRRAAFVASGDCSHRLTPSAPAGYSPRGAVFDAMLVDALKHDRLDDLVNTDLAFAEEAGECGLRSFVTLSGFLPGASTRVLAYEGPWGVGYLTAVAGDAALLDELATPESGVRGGMPGDEESPPVALARRAIETYVRNRRVIDPGPAEGLLARPAGAFVSLHRRHELRGCIGTIAPTAPTLAQEIVHNAIQAATADPRFPPLAPDELDDLEISVDVLHEPEPCTFEDLDPKRYGVIVSADWRRGLLLPDLEGVDTPEQQVAIAMRKAGIAPGERVHLERFQVDRYR
ncbi:MAG: AmmeMemoRadiSam system protein A [Anaerosomatales bacterium]|nr:AmmeMemoRadiSam system protein A [Anaerosomatales bacterium]